MHMCPSCGFANSEDATRCALCGRALAPAQHPEEPAFVVTSSAQQPEPAAPVPPPVYVRDQQPAPDLQPPPAMPPAPVTTPMQPPTMPPMPPYGAAPPPYGAPLPYPMPPGMSPPCPPLMMPRPHFTRTQWRNRYLLGLGLGFIPLLLALVGIGIIFNRGTPAILANNVGFGLIAALVLYIAVFIGMIVCLAIDRLRPIGYGLLTMVVAGPVIAVASCFAIPTLLRG